jgi:hypothetical protein
MQHWKWTSSMYCKLGDPGQIAAFVVQPWLVTGSTSGGWQAAWYSAFVATLRLFTSILTSVKYLCAMDGPCWPQQIYPAGFSLSASAMNCRMLERA